MCVKDGKERWKERRGVTAEGRALECGGADGVEARLVDREDVALGDALLRRLPTRVSGQDRRGKDDAGREAQ